MKDKFRSSCPITSAIDIIGDKWTLVIIKQMLFEQRKTFKDFSESTESIASNILSSRLKMLEEIKIITKEKPPHNKKTNLYILTEKGLSLIHVIIELALWSDTNIKEYHPGLHFGDHLKMVKINKDKFIKMTIDNYKKEITGVINTDNT